MEITRANILVAITAFCIFCNCSRPIKNSDYVSIDPMVGWQSDSIISLSLEFPYDSLQALDLYITLQILNNHLLTKEDEIVLDIDFISPKEHNYFDSVELPIAGTGSGTRMEKKNGIIELSVPYIKNIKNRETGIWTFNIKKNISCKASNNIIGLGLFYKTRKNER